MSVSVPPTRNIQLFQQREFLPLGTSIYYVIVGKGRGDMEKIVLEGLHEFYLIISLNS